MRRSRTPATAWPAVADLMTILAVVGLSAAAALSPRLKELKRKDSHIAALTDEIKAKDSHIAALQARVKALQENARDEIGFKPCWIGSSGEKRYFTTYDVTFSNGRYSVSRHHDFARGTRVVDELPVEFLAVLEDVPKRAMDEVVLVGFGRRVMDALWSFDPYPEDCRLAVTINPEVTGKEIEVIKQARFYPVYRSE